MLLYTFKHPTVRWGYFHTHGYTFTYLKKQTSTVNILHHMNVNNISATQILSRVFTPNHQVELNLPIPEYSS